MLALVEAFFAIMIRRRGPEDLPDSAVLLQFLVAVYLACQVPVGLVMYGWTGTTLALILADIALLAAFFWILLRATGHAARYRQTLSALLGTGALLSLVQAPLVALSRAAPDPAQRPAVITFALVALLAWMLLVQGHIASRALSRHFGIGMLVALSYFVLSFQLSTRISPAGPG